MPDIGRLAHRVWCGKVGGQGLLAMRIALFTATKRWLHRKTRLPGPSLTSIVDPDRVLQLAPRKFAIAAISTDGLGGWGW
jgi:hypothetical protein